MKLTQMMSGMMIMTNIPSHLLNSKLITDSEWEEYINLKHRNNILEERYNEALGILSDEGIKLALAPKKGGRPKKVLEGGDDGGEKSSD